MTMPRYSGLPQNVEWDKARTLIAEFMRDTRAALVEIKDGNPDAVAIDDYHAIHSNVAGEITAITEKTAPANTDVLLIEDSGAANVKKRVKVSSMPASSSGMVKVQSYDATSDVAYFDISDLDGDTDCWYRLLGTWVLGATNDSVAWGAIVLELLPNAVNPSPGTGDADADRYIGHSVRYISVGDTDQHAVYDRHPALGIAEMATGSRTDKNAVVIADFFAKRITGIKRQMQSRYSSVSGDEFPNNFFTEQQNSAFWMQDPGTNITSLRVRTRKFSDMATVGASVTGIMTGSHFTLYKMGT